LWTLEASRYYNKSELTGTDDESGSLNKTGIRNLIVLRAEIGAFRADVRPHR